MSIDHSTGCPISKKYTVNQGCMSLSTYLLEYGRHVARLRRRRRRRRRAYAPTSNTASHDNHKKILHGFPFLSRDDYGAPLGGPSGRRSSAIKKIIRHRRPCSSFPHNAEFGYFLLFLVSFYVQRTAKHESRKCTATVLPINLLFGDVAVAVVY